MSVKRFAILFFFFVAFNHKSYLSLGDHFAGFVNLTNV